MDAMQFMTTSQLQNVLHNKFVVVIGGSVMRSVYKDLVHLLQHNGPVPREALKAKGEREFCSDKLLHGGVADGALHNGKNYCEIRQYWSEFHLVRFYFVTRCFSKNVKDLLRVLCEEPKPDVIIMNSCLWDLTRYGPRAFQEYKKLLEVLFSHIRSTLDPACLFIWATTPPIGPKLMGGCLPSSDYHNATLKFDVRAASFLSGQMAMDYGFKVLDMHSILMDVVQWRVKDGIHWNPLAHRYVTGHIMKILTHVWGPPPFHGNHYLEQPMPFLDQNMNRPQNDFLDGNMNFMKVHDNMNYPQAPPMGDINYPPHFIDHRGDSPCLSLTEEEERYGGPIRRSPYMNQSRPQNPNLENHDPRFADAPPMVRRPVEIVDASDIGFTIPPALNCLPDFPSTTSEGPHPPDHSSQEENKPNPAPGPEFKRPLPVPKSSQPSRRNVTSPASSMHRPWPRYESSSIPRAAPRRQARQRSISCTGQLVNNLITLVRAGQMVQNNQGPKPMAPNEQGHGNIKSPQQFSGDENSAGPQNIPGMGSVYFGEGLSQNIPPIVRSSQRPPVSFGPERGRRRTRYTPY